MGFEETFKVRAEDGTSLNVYRRPGPGPSVIFAHGVTTSGRVWDSLLPELPAEWEIVGPDARAHGKSGRAPVYRWDDLVSDLARIIQDFSLTKPVLIGRSMGAATVATYTSRYPGIPCVVIEDPPWWPSVTKEFLREWAAAVQQDLEASQSITFDAHLESMRQQHPLLSAAQLLQAVEDKRAVDPAIFDIAETLLDWREVVAQIDCPTLLVTGNPSLGAIVTPEQAQEIRQLNPLVEVATFPNAGHVVSLHAMEDYIAAAVPFIRRFI